MVHSKLPNSNQHSVVRTPEMFMDIEKPKKRHKESDLLHNYQQCSEMQFYTVKPIHVSTVGAATQLSQCKIIEINEDQSNA